MRKLILLLAFCGLEWSVKAQDASVETLTGGVQLGAIGIWAYGEIKMTDMVTLRAEAGLDYRDISFGRLVMSFESRCYYNLNRRWRKNKRTYGNSGNFISCLMSLRPQNAILGDGHLYGTLPYNRLEVMPTWGIRRCFGPHFNFEFGIGVGIGCQWNENTVWTSRSVSPFYLASNLLLRIGYRF